MSHYISSFLIEPVVRQARRFSRPTNDPPHATDLRPSLEDDQAWAQHAALATAAAAAHEEPPQMRTSTDTGVLETVSPTSLTGLESGEVQAWQNGETSESSLRLVETDNLERAVNARRYTLTSTDDASRNPLHVIPDGFRSSASSLNHSARSIIDANMSPADPSMQSAGANDQDSRGREGNLNSRMGDGSLPADDGMGHMRKRILAIQRTDSSNEAKARLVHGVMTEQHNISQQSLHGPHFPRTHSPASIQSLDRPFTPSSPKSTDSLRQTVSPPTSSSSNNDGTNPFHLTLDDLKPTYYQKPLPIPEDADQEMRLTDSEEEPKALGCAHYKRNIKLQCSACSRWYTCRFCHDAVEDHMLNRRETKNMLCMLCGCAQPASEECVVCSERGAWYYCDVCKLWDDDPQKSIYHCNDCGICRIGQGLGKDFFHCKVSSQHQSIRDVDTKSLFRPAACACQFRFETLIAASNAQQIAIVLFAASTCSRLHRRSYS
ncbi:hypothetical protein MMC28_001577 [Mycoblastus sanguinarius]|nr:hypothetical protein [Mycoblastus sanguinarius]